MRNPADWSHARIFLTGGTGFLGKSLLKALGGHVSTTVLSRNPAAFLQANPAFRHLPGLSFVHGDVRSFRFPDSNFSHVIHAATDTQRADGDLLAYHDEIVQGTRRVLDFALACKAERFLLTSSGAVYGPQAEGVDRIAEDAPQAPSTMDLNALYGQGKRSAEHLCSIYQTQFGLACTVARCFAFVGEFMPLNGSYALGNFIRDALAPDRAAIIVQGDGTPQRSYLHTDELAHWLLTILQKGTPCRPYNVGSDQAISLAELAHLVRDLLAPTKPVTIAQQATDSAGRSRYVPAIDRARDELDLTVRIPLAEAIRATAAAIGTRN